MAQHIRGRKLWGARPPKTTYSKHIPEGIVIHHTAGAAPLAIKKVEAEIRMHQDFHMRPENRGGRGWNDIGYHLFIDRAGRIWEGRPLDAIGAHTHDHNTGNIGIAFMGNYEYMKPNLLQKRAYKRAVQIIRDHGYNIHTVNDHVGLTKDTACPGKNLIALRKWFRSVTLR